MTYERLRGYLEEVIFEIDNNHLNLEIFPDDKVLFMMNSIWEGLTFENDVENFQEQGRCDA